MCTCETREVPVFAFELAYPGRTGPQLRPHASGAECPTEQPTSTAPGRVRFGFRNVTIGFLADTFSAGTNLGRPMTHRTGLTGTVDFTLEWTLERPEPN